MQAHLSIRWKTLAFFAIFTLVMLLLWWVFQIVWLDEFYVGIKKRSTSAALRQAVSAVQSGGDYTTALDKVAQEYDVCISLNDSEGQTLYRKHLTSNCIIHNVRAEDLSTYYEVHTEKSGVILEGVFNRQDITGGLGEINASEEPPSDSLETTDNVQWHGEKSGGLFRRTSSVQSMLCIQPVTLSDGGQALLMVNAILTPVSATVDTLRLQLFIITALLVPLAVVLALFLSAKCARPIISISNEAKRLAQGDFDVHFEGAEYREAAQLADTLNYAAAELGKTDALRRDLMANISHDLRTPLTMIEGFAEMMRDLPSENTPENAQVIVEEARYLSALVSDILDLSRLESGVEQMRPEPLDLTDCLRQMLQRYSVLTQQEGYHIDVEAGETLMVRADRLRIQQALYNLVNNAIAYTGADKQVRVRLTRRGTVARVEVIDTGRGIAPEDLPHIWDRYYKVDRKNHRRAIVGTGLGLSIVKKILIAHNAAYGVESGPQGSDFWFELPLLSTP